MCVKKDVLVQNQVGLHARPATFFIQKANEFKSSIWIEKDERRVNAKSLLGVLSLGIVKGIVPRIFEMQRFVYLARGITVEPLTRNILENSLQRDEI